MSAANDTPKRDRSPAAIARTILTTPCTMWEGREPTGSEILAEAYEAQAAWAEQAKEMLADYFRRILDQEKEIERLRNGYLSDKRVAYEECVKLVAASGEDGLDPKMSFALSGAIDRIRAEIEKLEKANAES